MSASDVFVSLATEADLARIRALRLRGLADAPDAFASSHDEEAAQDDAFWRRRLERAHATLLVTHRGADAGISVVAAWDGEPGVAGLFGVWVAPEARGQGVGDGLTAAAVEAARSAGFERLRLEVGAHNTPARRLYERAGFVATGHTTRMPAPREHIVEVEMEFVL